MTPLDLAEARREGLFLWGDMTLRVYLTPVVARSDKPNSRAPKYFWDLTGVWWGAMDYGLEPVFLVVADVTDAQHAALVANADLASVPANLDASIGAAGLTAARNALEGFGIPGQWLMAGTTWREAVRHCARLFQFAQRLHGLYGVRVYQSGITLGTTVGSLTAGQRNALLDVAQSFGWDTSGVTGAMTLRQALKVMANQWSGPILIGGVEI